MISAKVFTPNTVIVKVMIEVKGVIKGMFGVLSVFRPQLKSCRSVDFRFSLCVGMTKLS